MALNSNPDPNLSQAEDTGIVRYTLSGITHTKFVEFQLSWTIDHFRFVLDEITNSDTNEDFLISPVFTVEAYSAKWTINLQWCDDKGILYLKLMQGGKHDDIKAFYKFSILNSERKEVSESEQQYYFPENEFEYIIEIETLLKEANDLLPNDTLTIRCVIMLMMDRISKLEVVQQEQKRQGKESQGKNQGEKQKKNQRESQKESHGKNQRESQKKSHRKSQGERQMDNQRESQEESQGDSQGERPKENQRESQKESQGDSQGESPKENQRESQKESQGDSQGESPKEGNVGWFSSWFSFWGENQRESHGGDN